MDVKELYELIEKEGDMKEFYYKEFRCMILRIPNMGHLCGYVEMSPMFEVPLDAVLETVTPHGNVTFQGELSQIGIEGFWLGFDCGHYNDIIPEVYKDYPTAFKSSTYRDMEYVEGNLMLMVEQMLFLRRKMENELRS